MKVNFIRFAKNFSSLNLLPLINVKTIVFNIEFFFKQTILLLDGTSFIVKYLTSLIVIEFLSAVFNTMNSFYNSGDGVKLYVYGSHTLLLQLQLSDFPRKRDTGFIQLPSLHTVEQNERFKFYIVCNCSEGDVNEFGLWIYAYHFAFNGKIKGCKFYVFKGRNRILLPPTTCSESVVGIYRSPCYEIVATNSILNLMIHLPNMTFDNANSSIPNTNDGEVHPAHGSTEKLKLVDLSDKLTTAYQEMMTEDNYDVYFVVDGQKIGSFKFPLCAVSEVFRANLMDHTKEAQAISDFEYNIVKIFVDALHTHKIYFNRDLVSILKLKMLANKFDVKSIETAALNAFDVTGVNQRNFVELYR